MEKLLEEIEKDNKQIGHLAFFVCYINDLYSFFHEPYVSYLFLRITEEWQPWISISNM